MSVSQCFLGEPIFNLKIRGTEDGWNPAPVELGRLSHYLQNLLRLYTSQLVQDFFHQQYDVK